jgi:hypothetical protein
MLHRFARSLRAVVLLIMLGLLVGCGAKTADVSGSVTFNGKAPNLEGLQISFLAQDGTVVCVPVALDGSFKARGVPVGDNQVGLSYNSAEFDKYSEAIAKARKHPDEYKTAPPTDAKPEPKGKTPDLTGFKDANNPIPLELRDPHTSKKTITVEGGKDNPFTWNITPLAATK